MKRLLDRILPRHPIWRFMVVHWLQGIFLGAVLAGGVLALDVGHLRSLILRSDMDLVALILLVGGFSLSFGGLVCGSAVMGLGLPAKHDDETGKGAALLVPVAAGRKARAKS